MTVKRTMRLIFLALIALTVLPWEIHAKDSTELGRLLMKFRKLGLPDCSKSKLMVLSPDFFTSHGLSPNKDLYTGKVWVQESSHDENRGRTTVSGIFLEGLPFKMIVDHERLQICNLNEDLKLMHRKLGEAKKKEFPDIYVDLGRTFCFALNLYQNGSQDEGSRLLNSLCEIKPLKEVVELGYNHLAYLRTKRAFLDFQKHKDWKRYARDIETLLAAFDARWEQRSGAVLLLKRLKMKIDGVEVKLDGFDSLAPKLQSLGKALNDIEEIDQDIKYSKETFCWLLPDTWKWKVQTMDLDLRIRALGAKALPLLMVLRKDKDTLTRVDGTDCFSSYHYDKTRLDGSPSENFRELPRPMTRGEVASLILEQMYPVYYDDSDKAFPGLKRFVEQFHDKGEPVIALHILKVGSLPYEWEYQSWLLLLNVARTQQLKAVEEYLKSQPSQYWWEERLVQYVSVRGREAIPLLETDFIMTIKVGASQDRVDRFDDESDEDDDQDDDEDDDEDDDGFGLSKGELAQKQKALRTFAKELRESPFGLNIGEFIESYISKKEPSRLFRMSVISQLNALSLKDAVFLILKIASKDTSARTRSRLGELLLEVVVPPYWKDKGKGRGATANSEWWQILMGDTQEFVNIDGMISYESDDMTVSDLYLIVYERLYNHVPASAFASKTQVRFVAHDHAVKTDDLCRSYIKQYGDIARRFVKRRISLRLKGSDSVSLPRYPGTLFYERTFSEDALSEAIGNASKNAVLIRRKMNNLTLEEACFLPELLETRPVLNSKLLPYANQIVEVDIQVKDKKWRRVFEKWKGKSVSSELIREMYLFCRERALAKKEADCMLLRRALLGGSKLMILPDKRRNEHTVDPVVVNETTGLQAQLVAGNLFAGAIWRVSPLKKEKGWWCIGSSSPSATKAFWKAVDDYSGNASEASSLGFIRFITKEDNHED